MKPVLSPAEEVQRAGHASQVLDDPMVKEALDDIEANVLAWWEASNVKETDFREKCWAIYCASRKFRAMLQTHMETGILARAQIEAEAKRKIFGLFRA